MKYPQEILDALHFRKFLSTSRPVSYKAQDPILHQGEVPKVGFYIFKGQVVVYDIDQNGDKKIITFATAGEFIPPAWVFNKSPVSLYYYDAFTPCKLYAVPKDTAQEIINHDKRLTALMFDRYMGLYTGALQQINSLIQPKSSDKLMYLLQHLALRFGTGVENGYQQIDIKLTHKDIANLAGLTRETTSIELHKLKQVGIIDYKDKYYSINPVKIRARLSSDEFIKYSY